MNQEDKIQTEYDEINLMDYVMVVLKRKRLIFGIFLIAVATSGIFSHFSPKIYEINTYLEIGKIKKIGKIEKTIIEEPLQIVEKIDNDIYKVSIKEKLGIQEGYPKTEAENVKNTNLVKIKIESAEPQKAKNILEEMNNLILAEHQERIKTQKELIENNIKIAQDKIKLVESDIEKVKNKIKITENDIEKVKNKIKPLENDIERVKNKIKYAGEEKENLEAKIEALEKVLVYEQTLGTQFALFDAKEKLSNKGQEIENLYSRINSLTINIEDLNLVINSLKRTKENYNSQINSLEISIGSLDSQINSLRASLSDIKNTKVIKKPLISDGPIKPRFLSNVAIAGILGLFMGIFLAFSKEWWQKNKNLKP